MTTIWNPLDLSMGRFKQTSWIYWSQLFLITCAHVIVICFFSASNTKPQRLSLQKIRVLVKEIPVAPKMTTKTSLSTLGEKELSPPKKPVVHKSPEKKKSPKKTSAKKEVAKKKSPVQKPLQKVEKSLAQSPKKTKPSVVETKKSTSPQTPSNVDTVNKQALFFEALTSIFKQNLTLPERGTTRFDIEINAQGDLIQLSLLSSDSEKNRLYLQDILPTLKLPCPPDGIAAIFTITFKEE